MASLTREHIAEEALDSNRTSAEDSFRLSKHTAEENKAFSDTNGEDAQEIIIPEKPASAYLTVSIICLCMAFGGFMSGWDTGTISGFVNQTDFLRRFGNYSHSKNTYYMSNVRTGLMVSSHL